MLNHTIHPQGRDSHNLNKYIWRFIALSTAQPRVITIEATSEQEARQKNQLIAIASQDDYPHQQNLVPGLASWYLTSDNTRPACFFVPDSHTLSMVGCMGGSNRARASATGHLHSPPPAKLAFPAVGLLNLTKRLPTGPRSLPARSNCLYLALYHLWRVRIPNHPRNRLDGTRSA